jgi:ATP-dependent RNA helicase RhlB
VAADMENWEMPAIERFEDDPPETRFFQEFLLDQRIQRGILGDLHFRCCTPIQGLALPHTLAGRDVCGKAQTGTGKTAAFLITVMQRFLNDPGERAPNQPMALVLAPTRELAIQIDKDAQKLSRFVPIRHTVVFGGADYDRQKRTLEQGVDLVAATPGRLLDYARHGFVDLSKVSVLIIDEADRMLDMGFIPDVRRVVRMTPCDKRQTLFFSATLTPEVVTLAKDWLREPVSLETESHQMVADGIEEVILSISEKDKLDWLLRFLKERPYERILIFRNRRDSVEWLYERLCRAGVAAEMMSGDVDQKRRIKLLERFRTGEIRVVVATDVAGRGIHVDDISHVINYDLPYEPEDYVHRIGRTGRAGKKGIAISLACESGCFVIPGIEEYISRPLPITHPDDWWDDVID